MENGPKGVEIIDNKNVIQIEHIVKSLACKNDYYIYIDVNNIKPIDDKD